MIAGEVVLGGRRLETAWWNPKPEATTIVLLHEGLGCVALWRDVPETLSRWTGLPVFAYSRFGYGQSDPAPRPWPMTYMQDEATAVLPRVLDAAGIGRCILLGHSDGGSIAAVHAGATRDPRLVALITIAAHFFVEDLNIASIRVIRDVYAQGDLRRRLGRYHRDVDNAFHGWNDAWLDARFRDFDITAYLPGIRGPILGLQGDADTYGSDAQLEILSAHSRVRVETRIIPDAKHAPHLEAKDATLPAITGFIMDLPS